MEFNIKKYLTENKLTRLSLVEEELPGELSGMDDQDIDTDDTEDSLETDDTWYKSDDYEDSEEFEKEPSTKDVKKTDVKGSDIPQKQATLKSLEDKKDALLMQLKSGQLTLDQYRASIGNIPTQIKQLRADIEKSMSISTGDEEGESTY